VLDFVNLQLAYGGHATFERWQGSMKPEGRRRIIF